MSGGFFRGTSADQDTRFSNKQAKLLRSQKFPPELDHLVDMTKVKMDVMRPWIATRATELLGFEDEVLINFVYGLLDVKVVDGKKIQIQLTGFMEKNTGKFMKELWTLLLSAQNNVSGVPQQFLDAKEEEQRKKMEENDRISQEIQKRKERACRELEREKLARIEDEDGDSKSHKTANDILSRLRDSSNQPEEVLKEDVNHIHKTRNGHSISPYETNTSPRSQQSSPSVARTSSKSGSSYGSYLKEGHKSRSSSVYSKSPGHSNSPRGRNYSSFRQLPSPVKYTSPHRHRASRSPFRRRSSPSRRRSISRSRNRYSSPYRRRSHTHRSPYVYHRSPSPLHRRSPSPVRRRSPPLRRKPLSSVHRRSYSPARLRSPIQPQRRSRSPSRHQSLIQHESPSPSRYESLSPVRGRSPFPFSPKYRKQSPFQSPVRRQTVSYNPSRQRKRSPSPHRSQSPLNRRSSKIHNYFVGRSRSGRPYAERTERVLPIHQNLVKEPAVYVDKSPGHSKFQRRTTSSRKLSRSVSSSRSPDVWRGGSISHHESSETSREHESPRGRDVAHHKNERLFKQNLYSHPDRDSSHLNENSADTVSLNRSIVSRYPATRHPVKSEIQRNDIGDAEKVKAQLRLQSPGDIEYGPGGARGGRNPLDDIRLFSEDRSPCETKEHTRRRDDTSNVSSNLQAMSKGIEHEESRHEREHGKKAKRKFDKDYLSSNYSDSDDIQKIEKQQHKRLDSSKRDITESSETGSQIDDKKEARRKKKEDKRLHKEEKRKRREERRRRRSERHAAKQKLKTADALSPPLEFGKHLSDADYSDDDAYQMKNSYKINAKHAEIEQKRLEIELRKKALESLRAKKAIND